MLTGRCACGAVRYRLNSEPYDSGWCHCRLCQRVSGSPGMVFTTVPVADFEITAGAENVKKFASTAFGERSFCARCGSPLTIHVRHQPDEIDIAAGTLDTLAAVAPGFHLYAGEMPPWADFDDGLPRFAALRPDTRGLAPGQTEG
ncbi:GFA family protein [Sphingomonas sp.]|uniref:GFA family protein n=1 Tax=Sphingomonas sp. TaxID=28214 RepID=UPI00286DECC2|nr:GFA family protein [Sphingomonas sp.]